MTPQKSKRCKTVSTTPSGVATQQSAARKRLRTIEVHLAGKQRDDGRMVWMMGDKASHADAAVFGIYAFGRMGRKWTEPVWKCDELPCVGRWVEGMLASGLVDVDQLAG